MTTKETLTSKFEEQKLNFNIYETLDEHIKSFITQLNRHPDIVTLFSCEGANSESEHEDSHSMWAYFGLNVSEQYWDYFWLNVVPDLISKIDVKLSTNFYDDVIFFHAVSIDGKYKFWKEVFKVFKKHGLIKELVYEKN